MAADPDAPDPLRPRVFGIGLNKTGTSSFHEAMTVLGHRSLHWGGPETRWKVVDAFQEGEPLLARLDPHYDAFSDVEVLSKNFPILDAQYPGSRFVLTVRPLDDWIDSRRRHVARNVARKAAGEYDGTFLVVDEEGWRREWERHVTRVRDHFTGRDDFLEIDLTRDAGWAPLCTLLGVPEPDQPFPWRNYDEELRASGRAP